MAATDGGGMSRRANASKATPRGFIPLKGGDEYDALTRWRRYLKFGRGVLKWIKRKYHKRVRSAWKVEQKGIDIE